MQIERELTWLKYFEVDVSREHRNINQLTFDTKHHLIISMDLNWLDV